MEEFFKSCSSIDLIEIEELLLRKYDINYILKLDVVEGIELIEKALLVDVEHMIWQRWLVDYLKNMGEKFMSFEEYKNKILIPNNSICKDSEEDLLKLAEDIEKKISQKKRGE